MKENPLKKLEMLGQAIWLDYIRRDLITSGQLRLMIEEDGLRGMTSNPSIFEKAIAESHIYDQDIHDLALKKIEVKEIYETLCIRDVQNAADPDNPHGIAPADWHVPSCRLVGTNRLFRG